MSASSHFGVKMVDFGAPGQRGISEGKGEEGLARGGILIFGVWSKECGVWREYGVAAPLAPPGPREPIF